MIQQGSPKESDLPAAPFDQAVRFLNPRYPNTRPNIPLESSRASRLATPC
jgi:hypothetical protein